MPARPYVAPVPPMTTLKVMTIASWTITGTVMAVAAMIWTTNKYDEYTTQEVTQMIESPTAAIVSAIDPTGKDLTAVTAQIAETKILLEVLKGKQLELMKNVTLRVGQVWERSNSNDSNPFEKTAPTRYEIVSLQGGYVEYKIMIEKTLSLSLPGFAMHSGSISDFVEYNTETLISE